MKKNYTIPAIQSLHTLGEYPLAASTDIISSGANTDITYGGRSDGSKTVDVKGSSHSVWDEDWSNN